MGGPKYMLLFGVVLGICFGALAREGKGLDAAMTGFFIGVFVPIPFLIVIGYVVASRHLKHTKDVWAKHTHTWYREAFPQNAHANGHVSCRHCGSHKTQVRNLMERTYMRLHSCAQCGETLYYSSEKV